MDEAAAARASLGERNAQLATARAEAATAAEQLAAERAVEDERARAADATGTTADEQRTAFEADKAAALEIERGSRGRARREHHGTRRGARDREGTMRRDRGGAESSNNLTCVLGDRSLTVAREVWLSFRPLRRSRGFLSRLRSYRA